MAMTKAEENRLVGEYLGLVQSRASRYVGCGVDFKDLVQEGCLGLLKAIRNWRPDGGASLGTYARRWIDVEIRRAVGTDRGGHLRPRPIGESLDAPPDHKGERARTLHEVLPDTSTPSPEEVAIRRERLNKLRSVLDRLSSKERDVVVGHVVNEKTLQETGERLGVTRERARQIELKALGRMKKALVANDC